MQDGRVGRMEGKGQREREERYRKGKPRIQHLIPEPPALNPQPRTRQLKPQPPALNPAEAGHEADLNRNPKPQTLARTPSPNLART